MQFLRRPEIAEVFMLLLLVPGIPASEPRRDRKCMPTMPPWELLAIVFDSMLANEECGSWVHPTA